MGFMDGLRRGRDAAIAGSKAAAARNRGPVSSPYGGCRVHGRRFDGCPLDRIEIARIEIEVTEIQTPPAVRPRTDSKRR
jgi:hypothetical protein